MPDNSDDASIADDSGLLRRIHPDQIVPNNNTGGRRLSSGAFKDPSMSVDAEPILHENGLDASFSLRDLPNFFLVRLKAGFCRSKNQTIKKEPNPPEQPDNPAHALVNGKKTGSIANAFRDNAEWVKKPSDGT